MILFKPVHVPLILSGRKTQTRRFWARARVKVGAIHWAQTRMLDTSSRFARLDILGLRQERLGDISDADVYAEGYDTRPEYFAALAEINRLPADVREQLEDLVAWVVGFRRMEEAQWPT